MGRGRAKAKQTKVVRELKYFSPDTDLSALQRELGGHRNSAPVDDDYDDPYSDVADKYADYSDYDDGPGGRSRSVS